MRNTLKLIVLGAVALILLTGVEGFTKTAKSVRGIPKQAANRELGEDVDGSSTTSVTSYLSEPGFSSFASSSDILKSCAKFALFSRTAITFDGPKTTVYTGDIGVAPGTSIEGHYVLKKGSTELNTDAAIECDPDQASAFDYLDSQPCTTTLADENLAGLTLTPGVYCSDSGKLTFTTSTLTLDAKGNSNAQFIFKTSTSVKTSTTTSFILQNGAQPTNVYWKVGTRMTLASSSSFVGNVLAGTGVEVDSSTAIEGRLLAKEEVTFAGSGRVSLKQLPSPSPSSSSSSSSLTSTSAIAIVTLLVTMLTLL